MWQEQSLNIHITRTKVSNSKTINSPSASHPTFGVASGGQDGAWRAEEVREITGKTFHLLPRWLPTAEEDLVAGSTSALPPRQPVIEEPGGAGGEEALCPRRGGLWQHHFSQAGRQPAPVKVRGISASPFPRLPVVQEKKKKKVSY